MFNLFYTKEAKKFLKKLDKQDKTRIISVLERCRVRPHNHIKKLISSPYYRLRIGRYRAILDIIAGKLTIMVIEVGHRRNIYK